MANTQQKGAGTPVVLRDRYNIYPGQPLPEFMTGTAQAFGAEDSRGTSKPLMALLVKPGVPYRTDALRILKGIETPGLMTLVDYGVVDWPPARRKVMAAIYERPLGGRVMADISGEIKRVEDNELIKKVIIPVAAALREMGRAQSDPSRHKAHQHFLGHAGTRVGCIGRLRHGSSRIRPADRRRNDRIGPDPAGGAREGIDRR